MIQAGELRHVLKVQRLVESKDAAGQPSSEYVDWKTVRGSLEPLSGREFIAAQAIHAQVSARSKIRFDPLIDETFRILHEKEPDSPGLNDVYDIAAVLPDPVSGRRYLTLLLIKRDAEGFRRGE